MVRLQCLATCGYMCETCLQCLATCDYMCETCLQCLATCGYMCETCLQCLATCGYMCETCLQCLATCGYTCETCLQCLATCDDMCEICLQCTTCQSYPVAGRRGACFTLYALVKSDAQLVTEGGRNRQASMHTCAHGLLQGPAHALCTQSLSNSCIWRRTEWPGYAALNKCRHHPASCWLINTHVCSVLLLMTTRSGQAPCLQK